MDFYNEVSPSSLASDVPVPQVSTERLAQRAKKLDVTEVPVSPSKNPPKHQHVALEPAIQARIDAELREFIALQQAELGVTKTEHWRDVVHDGFTAEQRATTTILVSGLTLAHDSFITAGLRGLGYKVLALDCPDTEALQVGKEFGNRGQCNPTYFTVGNLVKTLQHMRDGGMSTEHILSNYLFLTAGACGPCRFGSYTTEYRKALRDSGFDGFRVALFQQKGGLDQSGATDAGLQMNLAFFVRVLLSIMVGDALNALMYRIRPYELEAGATDRAVARCRAMLVKTLETPGDLWKMPATLLRVRRELAAIQVDRLVPKPKVGIIGEFWAMTTEGDGNYKMPSFLEKEGAEVDVQLVTAWLLYNLWEVRWDTQRRMGLSGKDGGRWGLLDSGAPGRTILNMHAADKALRLVFQTVANTMGLHGYTLPDMDELSDAVQGLYHQEVRGGEGHMEVAKLLLNTKKRKVNLTLSVKPFGCMPSSGVSDGVQTVVQALLPDALYLPVETTGDGAVNVYSRVQMMLFKARQVAERELNDELQKQGLDLAQARHKIAQNPWLRRTLRHEHRGAAATAANVVAGMQGRAGQWWQQVQGLLPA